MGTRNGTYERMNALVANYFCIDVLGCGAKNCGVSHSSKDQRAPFLGCPVSISVHRIRTFAGLANMSSRLQEVGIVKAHHDHLRTGLQHFHKVAARIPGHRQHNDYEL